MFGFPAKDNDIDQTYISIGVRLQTCKQTVNNFLILITCGSREGPGGGGQVENVSSVFPA